MTTKLKTIKGGALFIFDGIDGAGKTTQLRLAAEILSQSGWQVYITRNLGGSLIGEELRSVMLKPIDRPPKTELYISLAIQEALIESINSERQKGSIILLDRGPLSLVAYQSYGSGVDKGLGWKYADEGIKRLKPEMQIIYEIDINIARQRAKFQSVKSDYFESKPLDFFKHVKSGYQAGAVRYHADVIDADQTIEKIHCQTMNKINQFLSNIA